MAKYHIVEFSDGSYGVQRTRLLVFKDYASMFTNRLFWGDHLAVQGYCKGNLEQAKDVYNSLQKPLVKRIVE